METTTTRETVCTKLHEQMNSRNMRGLWLPSVRITTAKDTSRNPGALYVKDVHGDYFGMIRLDGSTKFVQPLTDEMKFELRQFATRGGEYLAEVGKETGNCCFCGRDLTDPESVALGYGPVCAAKYQMPHSNRHGF